MMATMHDSNRSCTRNAVLTGSWDLVNTGVMTRPTFGCNLVRGTTRGVTSTITTTSLNPKS